MKKNFIFIIALMFLAVFLFAPKANAATPLREKLKIICEEPCPVDAAYKREFKNRFTIAYIKLKNLTKTALSAEYFPLEIHLSQENQDKICDTDIPNSAFVLKGAKPGILCMLYQPKLHIRKYLATYYGNFAHEIMHYYFPQTDNLEMIEHPIIFTLERFISSPQAFTPNPPKGYARDPDAKQSFCEPVFGEKESKSEVVYSLCKNAGFDVKHIPAFFKELRAWTKANPNKLIFKQDYVEIFKKILNKDVSDLL